MHRLVLLCFLALLAAPGAAHSATWPGGDDATVRLPLANGDVLTATYITSDADSVTIEHPVLGRLTLLRAALALPAGSPLTAEALAPPPPPPPPPPAEPASPWSGTLDLGIDGSSGNTDEQNVRGEFKLRHEDDDGLWDSRVLFQRSESNGMTTGDRRFVESRRTWDQADSPWGPFAQASYEDDRFKDFDNRISVGGGASYTHRNDEIVRKVSRYGLALVKTTGGMDEGTTPEGILGLDYERQIDKGERFVSTLELLPDLSDLGEYRARADAAFEWSPDEVSAWMWKLGLTSSYDSTPGSAKSTDIDYFLSLGRRF